jgi:hypothetical protein
MVWSLRNKNMGGRQKDNGIVTGSYSLHLRHGKFANSERSTHESAMQARQMMKITKKVV